MTGGREGETGPEPEGLPRPVRERRRDRSLRETRSLTAVSQFTRKLSRRDSLMETFFSLVPKAGKSSKLTERIERMP